MKIAVTSRGKDLNAEVDSRFGRCQYFIIYNTETDDYEVIDNTSVSLGGGAGIQSAQTLAQRDVEAVLTGNVGPNAFQTLSAAGITIYAGVSGKVSEAIDEFKKGVLKPYGTPSVGDHFGAGAPVRETPKPSGKKRIAVAAEDDQGLLANVSAHFGRCPYYTMVEVEGKEITLSYKVENPFSGSHGAEGEVPGFIHSQGADVIIAGGMGQRAVGFFKEFGIEVITSATGKVKDAVKAYLEGNLTG